MLHDSNEVQPNNNPSIQSAVITYLACRLPSLLFLLFGWHSSLLKMKYVVGIMQVITDRYYW